MKIRYLGHSCFLLTESTGTRILTDPYGDVGFKMPRVEADVVSVSHGHYDHNNVKAVGGKPVVLDKEGQYEVGGVEIIAVKSYHDNANGEERGENLIFKFRLDGIEVCHLGDFAHRNAFARARPFDPRRREIYHRFGTGEGICRPHHAVHRHSHAL